MRISYLILIVTALVIVSAPVKFSLSGLASSTAVASDAMAGKKL